jgi:APA family basic amino acid/polyamine antiporter
VLHKEARTVGMGWVAAGMVGYVVFRRRSGLDLTTSVKIERGARPPDFVPLEYGSALVPLLDGDVTAKALRSAAKLVGPQAVVDVLYLLHVPHQLSLDGPLESEEAAGRSALEAALLTGRREGIKVRTALLRTRNPGRAVVEEARRLNSEVVYMSTSGLDATAQYLLAERPCRIVIETSRGA